jgi:hypothetical protein
MPSVLLDRLDQMVNLTTARHLSDLEAASFEDPPQFQIRSGTVDGVNPPLQRRQTLATGVALRQGGEREQHSLATPFDVGQLQDESVGDHLEAAKYFGRARPEDERLTAQNKGIQALAGESEDLLRC